MDETKKDLIHLISIVFIAGLFFGFLIGGFLASRNKTCENLKEDYDWLKESSTDCWNQLRLLDTKCWIPNDCNYNPNLEGCNKLDCNWCCFNSCTLMDCSSNTRKTLEENK